MGPLFVFYYFDASNRNSIAIACPYGIGRSSYPYKTVHFSLPWVFHRIPDVPHLLYQYTEERAEEPFWHLPQKKHLQVLKEPPLIFHNKTTGCTGLNIRGIVINDCMPHAVFVLVRNQRINLIFNASVK